MVQRGMKQGVAIAGLLDAAPYLLAVIAMLLASLLRSSRAPYAVHLAFSSDGRSGLAGFVSHCFAELMVGVRAPSDTQLTWLRLRSISLVAMTLTIWSASAALV